MGKSPKFEGPRKVGGNEGYSCSFYHDGRKGHPVVVFDRNDPFVPCVEVTINTDRSGEVTRLSPTTCLEQRKYGLCHLGVKASTAERVAANNVS